MKAGPALAAGNAIIIKTSEKAPLACALAAGLTKAAGFPPGVISVLTGAGETGKLIAEHQEIRKISFTGSTNTGRLGEHSLYKPRFDCTDKQPLDSCYRRREF